MAGAYLTAEAAGVMNQATTIPGSGAPGEDSYVSLAYQINLTWEDQLVHFVGEESISFTVTDPQGNSTEYDTIYLESQYADVAEATNVIFEFDYAYATGEYEVMIPAGIVANSEGDINPAQTVYFNFGWQMTARTIEPEQSNYFYNSWTGEVTLPAYYKSEELSDVTVGFDEIQVQLTNFGEISAVRDNTETIDITDLVSIEEGKLKLDLSTLDDGTWIINVPEGFLKGYNAENNMYVNNGFTLKYMIINTYSPITEYTILSPSADTYYVNSLGQIQVYLGGEPFTVNENATAKINYNGEIMDGALSLGYNESKGFVLNIQVSGSEPGLYEVTVPEGSISAGQYTNPEIKASYYVLQQIYGEYEVSPESDSMVSTDEINNIIITYPNFDKIVPISDDTNVEILIGDYNDYYTLTMGDGIEISGNQIILTLRKPIQQDNYYVSIYANNFILDDDFSNGYISLTYTVWDGMKPATVLERPGKISTYDASVKLTWDYQTISPTDIFGVEVTYGYLGDLLDVPSSAIQIESNNVIYLDLAEYLKAYLDEDDWNTETEINVIFPAGIVKNEEGLLNPEQTISFTLYSIWDSEVEASVYPAADNMLQVYWEGINWIETDWEEPAILTISNGTSNTNFEDCGWGEPDFGFYSTWGYIDDDWDKGPCVLVNVGDIPGYYTLSIPTASFLLRDENYRTFTNENSSIAFQIGEDGTITVGQISTQINSLESDGIYRVIDLRGVNILNTTDWNEVRSLNKGLYIINGKKIIL